MNWHIGQKIVCIKSHNTNRMVLEGREYVINGLRNPCCTKSGVLIDVGITASTGSQHHLCGTTLSDAGGILWISEYRFANK